MAQTAFRQKISTDVKSWGWRSGDRYAQLHNDVDNFTEKLQNRLVFEEKKGYL